MKLISANEVKTLPRGRKATFDDALLKALSQVKDGNFGVLDSEFGAVAEDERGKVSATIRKHWAKSHNGGKCQIRWSPEGFAQVAAAK